MLRIQISESYLRATESESPGEDLGGYCLQNATHKFYDQVSVLITELGHNKILDKKMQHAKRESLKKVEDVVPEVRRKATALIPQAHIHNLKAVRSG